MNRLWFQSRRLWLAFLPCLLLLASMVSFHLSRVNPLYPALDKLTAVSLTERWSNPEMVKIRQLGKQAVPVLRRVLREKDAPSTRFLLWLKRKWPGVTRYYPYVPDAKKLSERRWVACQVLQTLGPAGRSATPDLIKIIASKDPGDVNGGSMALWAVGIDAEACQQLDEVMEKGMAGFGRSQIIMALANVKPPSDRTLKALTHALTDKSPYVAYYAAEALGRLGVASPAVISGLEKLVSTSTNDLTIVTASGALWELGKDSSSITGHVVPILEKQLLAPIPAPPGGGNGGQGVEEFEQLFSSCC